MARRKNPMGKARPVEDPYKVFVGPGIEIRVLKSYKIDHDDQWDRWLCATRSVENYGSLVPRDAYVDTVLQYREVTLEEAEAIWDAM
jgi:hypothetical protein